MNEAFDEPTAAPGLDAVERALAGALAHRAGGTLPAAPAVAADETRLVAIEAAIASGSAAGGAGAPSGRRALVLLTVAAAVVALVFVAVALTRGAEQSTDVRTGGDGTNSTSATSRPPGTTTPSELAVGTTLVAAPVTTTSSIPVMTPSSPVAPATAVGPSTTRPTVTDIHDVDLRNFTYPMSLCRDVPLPQSTFTLIDGALDIGTQYPNYVMRLVGDVNVGDATGDGVDDAVAQILCAPGGTDGYLPELAVVSVVGGVPRVIASLPGSGTATTQTVTPAGGAPYDYTPSERVVELGFVDGHLRVRWEQFAWGRPDVDARRVTISYRWDGSSFAVADESDVEIVPGVRPDPPPPTDEEKKKAIESFDFRTSHLYVPDIEGSRPCAFWFRDGTATDPVVDGVDIVRRPGGEEIGTLAVKAVQYADLSGDGIEEAIVIIRCTTPTNTNEGVLIYQWTPTGPVLFDDLTALSGGDEETVEVHADPECVLVIIQTWNRPEVYLKTYRMVLRWTPTSMQLGLEQHCA